ncbi:MAG TPA: hypothetical protein VFJ82_21390 [Longimicrobium sp.]|nr:hypothetical protein [Longimicrobium sp.]
MKIFQMLERSSATEPFRDALERFLRDGRPNERITFNRDCPPVKVERWLTKALEEYPQLHIESIDMRALSGCEYFRGHAEVHTPAEVRRVSFHWDCRWKAQELGWNDYFGYPDQIRAARECGHDCFRVWNEEEVRVKAIALAGELDGVDSGEPVPA